MVIESYVVSVNDPETVVNSREAVISMKPQAFFF